MVLDLTPSNWNPGRVFFAAQVIIGPWGTFVTHPDRVLDDGVPGISIKTFHNVLHRLCLHTKQLPILRTLFVVVPYLRAQIRMKAICSGF